MRVFVALLVILIPACIVGYVTYAYPDLTFSYKAYLPLVVGGFAGVIAGFILTNSGA